MTKGLSGNRGVMRRLPIEPDKRRIALMAVDRLLAGAKGSCSELFGSAHLRAAERKWQLELMGRLIDDGSVRGFGTTCDRAFECHDANSLEKIRPLLLESDPTVVVRGFGNSFELTPYLRAYFDGLLLGDGHYVKMNSAGLTSALSVSQCLENASWLEKVRSDLSKCGVKSELTRQEPKTRILRNGKVMRAGTSFLLRTPTYRTLKPERFRWYPNGKKVVPRDLDVSQPITLANWHMGDGCAYAPRSMVVLSTCCFTAQDVQWLSDQLLLKLGLKSNVVFSKGYPVLELYTRSAERFLEIVRPLCVPCFDYKTRKLWAPPNCVKCGDAILNRIRTAKYCDKCCSPDLACARRQMAKRHAARGAGAHPGERECPVP